MVFCDEDCILIENLYRCKGYGAEKLIIEFPGKGWSVRYKSSAEKFAGYQHFCQTTIKWTTTYCMHRP